VRSTRFVRTELGDKLLQIIKDLPDDEEKLALLTFHAAKETDEHRERRSRAARAEA
jgi:hypothetical protein